MARTLTNLISFTLFLIYFFSITRSYLEYSTITNVDIFHASGKSNLLDTSLCMYNSVIMRPNRSVDIMKSTYELDEIISAMTVSGLPVNIVRKPYSMPHVKCWKLDNDIRINPITGNELYEIRLKMKLFTTYVYLNRVPYGRGIVEVAHRINSFENSSFPCIY